MLDAHAHGKRLALHAHARIAQHLKRIARRMAARQNNAACRDALRLARCKIAQDGAAHVASRYLNPLHERTEAHLATCLDDALAHVAHHVTQVVSANVGLCLPQNLLGRARGHELLKHMANMRAFRSRIQLAIRKRARAAFAELDIRRLIKRRAGVKGIDSPDAILYAGTALDHQRPHTRPRQVQRAEKARRARAHHHGTRKS